jgi:thiamine biosynthesis protein ThiS
MNIIVNGNQHELAVAGTLGQLLKELEIVPERVAIMVNDRVISKASRAEVVLRDGDRIEILTFIGGG